MKHILYKTTNLLNGMIYIGIHSTNKVEDGYLGSGSVLKLAIRKYGPENFKREILEYLPTRKSLLEKEAKIVDQTFISREDTYNIKFGGEGYFGPYLQSKSHKTQIVNKLGMYSEKVASKARVKAWDIMLKKYGVKTPSQLGKKYVTNTLTKQVKLVLPEEIQNLLKEGWILGRKLENPVKPPSSINTKWVSNPLTKQIKLVSTEEVDSLVLKGWILGRKC